MPDNTRKRNKNMHMSELNTVDKKKKQHPFLWIFSIAILVIIVVSFVGAPLISNIGKSGNKLVFGKFADHEIEYTYGSYFARQLDSLSDQFKDSDSDNYQYQTYQLWKSAYDRSLFHAAVLYYTDISGIHVSENRIDKALTQYGPYMDNGKFSPELYKATPSSERYSNRKLFREELLQQQFVADITDRLYAPDELSFIKDMSTSERNFRYVAFPVNEYPMDEVSKYASENSDQFRTIKLSRISLNDNKKEAQAILNQLNENPSLFEDLAQNQSTDFYADKGGDMGDVQYYSLISDVSDSDDLNKIFSLTEGEITGLIETPYGFSIYRCNGPAREANLENDEEIKQVFDYMQVNEKGLIEDYFVSEAGNFKTDAEADGFTEAAASHGLQYYMTDFFPVNYGNSYLLKQIQTVDNSQYFNSVATDERFLKSLFSLDGDELTEPSIVGDAILVAQLIEERSVDSEELSYMDSFYPYLVQQFQQIELTTLFMDSEKHTNNFINVFSQYVLAN